MGYAVSLSATRIGPHLRGESDICSSGELYLIIVRQRLLVDNSLVHSAVLK